MKTNKLTGAALDWAVAKCEGKEKTWGKSSFIPYNYHMGYRYSTDWSQGGPIIDRKRICIDQPDDLRVRSTCQAFIRICITGQSRRPHYVMDGPTPLIAAMRCYVASKLGDEAEVPEELLRT